jgi:hypothetical protein
LGSPAAKVRGFGGPKELKLDIQKIVADLKNEKERLDRAIAALEETDSQPGASKSRMLTKPRAPADSPLAFAKTKTRGRITDEKRRRLSESMKKSRVERRQKG